MLVSMKSIDPGPNLRSKIDPKGVERLAGSMAAIGLLQPIVLVPAEKEGRYTLVAGFRRFEAAKQLKWAVIDASVKDSDDGAQTPIMNAAENVRIDPAPYDMAVALDRFVNGEILEDGSRAAPTHTRDEIAAALGLSRGYVNNLIRCVEKCSPTVLAAWKKDPDNITTKLVAAWVMLPHEEQDAYLAEYLGGSKADRKIIKEKASASKGKKKGARSLRSKAEIAQAAESLKNGPRREALEWVLGARKTYE